MKVAFAGKGGVGKTTLSAAYIKILSDKGREVLALDCDPDSNLGITLGIKGAETLTPIIEMEDLIRERMGVSDDGSFFKLNPKIDDIPDKFSKVSGNIRLVVMGPVKKGGTGCACPENAFVKTLIEHLVLKRTEDVVMDMEAGVEHFGRGTAAGCDSLIVVAEPSRKSIESAKRIISLANDLGIKKIYGLANKIRWDEDRSFIAKALEDRLKIIEAIPYSEEVIKMDKSGSIQNIGSDIFDKMKKVEQLIA